MASIEHFKDDIKIINLVLPRIIPEGDWLETKILSIIIKVIEKKQKFVLYIDASPIVKMPVMSSISTMVKFMKKYEGVLPGILQCTSIVALSKLSRGFLKMLFKVKPPVAPLKIVKNKQEGYEFLDSIC